jgi:hypothetical protein
MVVERKAMDCYGLLKNFDADRCAEATRMGKKRHQTSGGIPGDPPAGAKLLFSLAFPSGYTWMFQAAGSQEASRASADRGEESQIRERGEVCAVLFLCY